MAPATRSRRPLPRRVYWFRRLLVLGLVGGVVTGMVLGIAGLLEHSNTSPDGQRAAPVASSPRQLEPQRDRGAASPDEKRAKKRERGQEQQDRLARPEGPCEEGDVLVTPEVPDAHLGAPVRIVLEVTSIEADACYWEASAESVFLNIEGEHGTLWSSQQCPATVPTDRVVARKESAAKVPMWWNGKESDDGCPSWAPWVDAVGSYTAVAAARGSTTPIATGFFLGPAVAPTITQTPTPTPDEPRKPGRDRAER